MTKRKSASIRTRSPTSNGWVANCIARAERARGASRQSQASEKEECERKARPGGGRTMKMSDSNSVFAEFEKMNEKPRLIGVSGEKGG